MSYAVHINPFAGKCIHGVKGARYIEGSLKSPICDACFPPPKSEPSRSCGRLICPPHHDCQICR